MEFTELSAVKCYRCGKVSVDRKNIGYLRKLSIEEAMNAPAIKSFSGL